MTPEPTTTPTPAMREVEHYETHPEPMSFRQLCERVVPSDTRFLVLDLDDTVHRGFNLGERLGWELSAYQSYGQSALERLEPTRGHRLVVLDPQQPRASLGFVARGLWRWTGPGLYYLVWGKLAAGHALLGRLAVARHGEQFMQRAQRAVQLTLMRQLAEVDPALVRALAQRVWGRLAPEQVITREDLEWLRARHPGLDVILTSASPEPMVEVAATELGVERYVFSTLDRINSGVDKIVRLRELWPEVLDPALTSVGMTDTQYGEDHSWADHFSIVVDINSSWPFPRSVRASSPVRAIHSARLLTQAELHAVSGQKG